MQNFNTNKNTILIGTDNCEERVKVACRLFNNIIDIIIAFFKRNNLLFPTEQIIVTLNNFHLELLCIRAYALITISLIKAYTSATFYL